MRDPILSAIPGDADQASVNVDLYPADSSRSGTRGIQFSHPGPGKFRIPTFDFAENALVSAFAARWCAGIGRIGRGNLGSAAQLLQQQNRS